MASVVVASGRFHKETEKEGSSLRADEEDLYRDGCQKWFTL